MRVIHNSLPHISNRTNDRYKKAGAFTVDPAGNGDSVEFLNISKNDALAWPGKLHRDYPSTVNARMESVVKPFVVKSEQIVARIIDVFNDKLGLREGALGERHRIDEPSGCEARCIKSPPLRGSAPDKVALSPHTDFGSLVRDYCKLTLPTMTYASSSLTVHPV